VEIQRLRLARDWQPMLRPTRHRESFFFNPDAGRNAPTLPVEWGRGPTMAAVDPLTPFSADAPLLQVRQLESLMALGLRVQPASGEALTCQRGGHPAEDVLCTQRQSSSARQSCAGSPEKGQRIAQALHRALSVAGS
jgi:hypothetical protein